MRTAAVGAWAGAGREPGCVRDRYWAVWETWIWEVSAAWVLERREALGGLSPGPRRRARLSKT